MPPEKLYRNSAAAGLKSGQFMPVVINLFRLPDFPAG